MKIIETLGTVPNCYLFISINGFVLDTHQTDQNCRKLTETSHTKYETILTWCLRGFRHRTVSWSLKRRSTRRFVIMEKASTNILLGPSPC